MSRRIGRSSVWTIYEWVQNVAVYLVLMTAIIEVIPNKEYQKYVKFYMGLVVVIMLCTPIIKVLGLEERVDVTYNAKKYRMEFDSLLEESTVMGEVNISDYISETMVE